MAKLSQKETQDLLIGAGREVAAHQLEIAVENAPSVEVMNNQIEVIRRSAISILALGIYNEMRQSGREAEIALAEILGEISEELDHCETEGAGYKLVTPKGR